jgi:tetratricopeptide (TPR) repeat protein
MSILSAGYRLSITAALAALLMVPGFFAYHFAGVWGGAAIWSATYLAMAWSQINYLHRHGQTIMEALTAGRPDVEDKPLWLVLFGLVFAAAGTFVWLTDMQRPQKGPPTPPVEQFVFGAMFFFAGCGAAGIGVFAALIRRGMRLELAEIDDRIAMRPDSAELYEERAALLMSRDETARAIDSFSEAIRRAPQRADLYVRRGEARYYLDRNDEAIADLTRAIELDPANSDAFGLRSLAYEQIDQPELAKADEDRAAELDGTTDMTDGPEDAEDMP